MLRIWLKAENQSSTENRGSFVPVARARHGKYCVFFGSDPLPMEKGSETQALRNDQAAGGECRGEVLQDHASLSGIQRFVGVRHAGSTGVPQHTDHGTRVLWRFG